VRITVLASWLRGSLIVMCLGLLLLCASFGSAEEKQETTAKEPPDSKQANAETAADDNTPAALLAGHSLHGEAFNEGPRQKAYLMGGTGKVHLKVTTSSPEAQKFIDQGVGQLHGFWWFEAERSFRQAAALDPECAIAYWGMAMANSSNASRSKGFITKAVELKKKVSRREQLWIEALEGYVNSKKENKQKRTDWIRALEDIVLEFPDELEAKAFSIWAQWDSNGSVPIVSHEALNALIGDVLAVEPMHPVHHYRIHLWDGRKPARALESAALCGQGAPTIAHMWHMPGHIYWKLQRYADSAWQQEASARVDHLHMVEDGVMPYQIHNYAHNNEWLTRSLSHVGRVRDAVDLAKNMIELPRHPKKNNPNNRGSGAYFGRTRLYELLSRYELWDDLIALGDTMYLNPGDDQDEQIRRLRALGTAYFSKGDIDGGRRQFAALEDLEADLKEAQKKAGQEAAAKARDEKSQSDDKIADDKIADDKKEDDKKSDGNKADDEPAKETKTSQRIAKAKKDAEKAYDARLKAVDTALSDLGARLLLANGDKEKAMSQFGKVKDLSKEQLAQLNLQAGNQEKAETLARQAADAGKNQVQPLANYADILYRVGKTKEAAKAFQKLREMSSTVDPHLPVMERLAPIAKELGLEGDWRAPVVAASDVGVRPDLNKLGPFRWHPSQAPQWELADSTGRKLALKDFQGRPVVLIFYLGHGCLHCVEQLKKFAPLADKYAEAGIALVAVSIETPEDIALSLTNFNESGEFPITLLSDHSLETFKAYRAYDDFEALPLHGTFLIDGNGQVRWQDISFEPFTDATFLLGESKRLLSQPTP
jgi:peroxiredoxin